MKLLILLIIFKFFISPANGQNNPMNIFDKLQFIQKADTLPYRLLNPIGYGKQIKEKNFNQKYPLIIFLHGAGERGKDNERNLTLFGANISDKKMMEKYPCFVIIPQCPENKKWVDVDWTSDKNTMPESPSASLSLVMKLVNEFIKTHPIDVNRIYITGLSMGGFGTWDYICRKPDLFAAAIPICGGGDENQASKIINIPIWAFHGGKDKVVKPIRSKNMIEAIKKAGGNPKYTEYKNTAHNAWIETYKNEEVFQWLFNQKKKSIK